MRPGEDCQVCHAQGATVEGHAHSHFWTVSGTVYDRKGAPLEGARILVTDAAGRSLRIVSNGAGNFYTAEPLDTVRPFQDIEVEYNGQRLKMPWNNSPGGACNSCHTVTGRAGSKTYAPTD